MMTSDFRLEGEIWRFRACAMHPAMVTGTVRSSWTWLWGRYHVPQNVLLVSIMYLHLLWPHARRGALQWCCYFVVMITLFCRNW